MYFVKVCCLLGLFGGVLGQNDCLDHVYGRGLNTTEKALVFSLHNKYRKNICDGLVPGQPRGKYLLKLLGHDGLQNSAKLVSDRCIFSHYKVAVDPWKSVGQNLYKEYSNVYTAYSNWTRAVSAWFNEYSSYNFGVGSKDGKAYLHYTQVIWAATNYIGCDYVFFYNTSNPTKPYTKIYTCNYGQPGNVVGQNPYTIGNEGCPQL